jgi:aminobenzoyl-glutamate utilization protein B
VVSQGKSETAHKGMLYAGKSIALAAIELMETPELLKKARMEYEQAMEGQTYMPIPDDIKPRALNQIR